MFYLSSKRGIGKDAVYSVTDTLDNITENYTAEQLVQIMRTTGVKIAGFFVNDKQQLITKTMTHPVDELVRVISCTTGKSFENSTEKYYKDFDYRHGQLCIRDFGRWVGEDEDHQMLVKEDYNLLMQALDEFRKSYGIVMQAISGEKCYIYIAEQGEGYKL